MVTNVIVIPPVVNHNYYHLLLNDIVKLMQPFVTNCFVEKAKQWHFYVPPSLRSSCEDVFRAQGVSVSEGLTRLIKLLVDSPDELTPILLDQAKGNAAVALAEEILRRSVRSKGHVMRKAAKREE